MKKIALFILVCMLGCSPPTEETPSRQINWVYDYARGIQLAKETGRPVLLFFSASWCPPCKELLATVFSNQEVAQVSRQFVNIYLDVDQDTKTRTQYKIREIPTIYFLNSEGKIIQKFEGQRSASNFIDLMHSIASEYLSPLQNKALP